MKNTIEPTPGSEDDLKASNEVLKLKLELEHGMQMSDTKGLPPEVENQWLRNVYDYEKQFKDGGRTKVYDFVGQPDFVKWESLTEDQLREAIEQLMNHMCQKGVQLDFLCDYPDRVVYRFITEEFFKHEMDNIVMKGGFHGFIYEEFHPNHDYDLRRFATDFTRSVFDKKWNAEFHEIRLSDTVFFHNKHFTSSEISGIILAFQEAHTSLAMKDFVIDRVTLEPGDESGLVEGTLVYTTESRQGESTLHEGRCTMYFIKGPFDWDIDRFAFPGLGG